jgi:MoaA/NifB/PqqE/SkfB family radical SAM enzyme
MKLSSLPRKVVRGLPYLIKETRAILSDRTPFFVAVPRTVHIWREAPCNARCIMCTFGFLKGEAFQKLAISPLKDEIFPRLLREIRELCGRGTLVSLLSGEPTVSPRITEWIELASRLGLDLRFTTNGYRMDEEMARRFVAAGLFNIGVSIESLDPKINETIRPYPQGTARTLRCIALLLRERRHQQGRLSLNIKTVLTNINLESFVEIAERFAKLDGVICTPQVFEPLEGMPRATRELLRIKDPDRLQRVTDQIRALQAAGYSIHVTDQGLDEMVEQCRQADDSTTAHHKNLQMDPARKACNIGTDNLWIHNGEVKLCPYFPPIGNVTNGDSRTLKQMWASDQARQLRHQIHACRRLCTLACLRRTPLRHKISTFLKLA